MKPREKEDFVRKRLEEMFGELLLKRRLIIGYDSRKFPKIHEFDLVSVDGEIVGEITSTRKDEYKAVVNCYYLTRVQAKKKILALTDTEFYSFFKSKYDGVLPKDIEILLVRVI